ncbi:hypothetical protein NM208_g8929 [Fusarium decemcellulare]|uniref:Uncharacterized protein n=1 Tax=Fusarium decemcellulare TaxID=57161 RepID=A0ACC1S3K5_9HYPO|nr:hypothetical protein NM208_g8929 [Fusarium decemcellulare]
MNDLIVGATPLYARHDTPAITLRNAILRLADCETTFSDELYARLEECIGNEMPICPVAFHGQAPMPRGAASPSSTPRKRKDGGSKGYTPKKPKNTPKKGKKGEGNGTANP